MRATARGWCSTRAILPQARAAYASASTGYQSGRVEFGTLLEQQASLYGLDTQYLFRNQKCLLPKSAEGLQLPQLVALASVVSETGVFMTFRGGCG